MGETTKQVFSGNSTQNDFKIYIFSYYSIQKASKEQKEDFAKLEFHYI
jgi:hypothetical protein